MPRPKPVLLLAATALVLPSTAAAAANPPADLLAAATPLSDAVPPPSHATPLSDVPIADAGMSEAAALLAANPEAAGELLAQAPPVTARPPATLPRTGSELLITLLLGGGLALTGAGLRLRLRGAADAAASAEAGLRPRCASGVGAPRGAGWLRAFAGPRAVAASGAGGAAFAVSAGAVTTATGGTFLPASAGAR